MIRKRLTACGLISEGEKKQLLSHLMNENVWPTWAGPIRAEICVSLKSQNPSNSLVLAARTESYGSSGAVAGGVKELRRGLFALKVVEAHKPNHIGTTTSPSNLTYNNTSSDVHNSLEQEEVKHAHRGCLLVVFHGLCVELVVHRRESSEPALRHHHQSPLCNIVRSSSSGR